MIYKDFEDYLKEVHAQQYHGLDDEMTDDFEKFLDNLDIDVCMLYADRYATEKYKEGYANGIVAQVRKWKDKEVIAGVDFKEPLTKLDELTAKETQL
jgi:succinate dehydrogenase flavin-adding protein (antitoxin of CptAB toxin-antitoxin module)